MPAGLQVWGPTGDLWVDTNHHLTRVYGNMVLGPGNASQTLPQLSSQGTPFSISPNVQEEIRTQDGVDFRAPVVGEVSWSSTTVSVVFPFVSYVNAIMPIYYGAY